MEPARRDQGGPARRAAAPPGLPRPPHRAGHRALFLERLEVTLAQVGPQRPVAVCLIDLDKLKEANDRYGHQAGDALLKVVGQRFRAAVRPGDVVARLGGDEFGVLFEGVDAGAADAAAQRLIRSLEEPVTVGDVALDVSASFGLSLVDEPGMSVDRCIEEADMAMYGAKSSRTETLVVFDPSMVRDDPARARGDRRPARRPRRPGHRLPADLHARQRPGGGLRGAHPLPGPRPPQRRGVVPPRPAVPAQRRPRGGGLASVLSGPRPDRDRYLSVNVSPEALQSPEVQSALPAT